MSSSVVKKFFNEGVAKFYGSGTNAISLKAPSNASQYSLELPASSGSLNQILKRTHNGFSWGDDNNPPASGLNNSYIGGRKITANNGPVEIDAGSLDALIIKGKQSVGSTLTASGAFIAKSTIAATGNITTAGEVSATGDITSSQTLYGLNLKLNGTPWFDVTHPDFGALGNGNANDTTPIQNAINAAALVKGRVYIPHGTYNVSWLTMASGVMLFGDGFGTILAASGTTGGHAVIEVNNKSDWAIENIKIDGKSAESTLLADTLGLMITGTGGDCQRYRVRNIWLYDCHYRGFNLRSGIDAIVENIFVEKGCDEVGFLVGTDNNETFTIKRLQMNNIAVKDTQTDGAGIYRYNASGTIKEINLNGLHVSRCGLSHTGHGFFVTNDVTDVNVDNFVLASGGDVNGNGLHIEDCQRLKFSNGIVKNFKLYGLSFTGNNASDHSFNNISLHENSRGVVMGGNLANPTKRIQFNNVITSRNLYDGFFIAGNNLQFVNCLAYDNGQGAGGPYAGFYLQSAPTVGAPSGISFVGCKGYDTGGNTQDHGINFGDNCKDIHIDNSCRFSGPVSPVLFSSVPSKTEVFWDGSRAGWKTENSGTGSVLNTTAYIDITHGLDITPRAQDIQITPTNNPTNDIGLVWVDNIGATTFRVNCEADPGGSHFTFAWKVNAKE